MEDIKQLSSTQYIVNHIKGVAERTFNTVSELPF